MAIYQPSATENVLRLIGIHTVYKSVDPTTSDTRYGIPTLWINQTSNEAFLLVADDGSTATWASATSGADLSNVNNIIMNTSPTSPSTAEGSFYWDSTDHCLTVHNDEADTSLQVGQELVIRVRNETGSVISDGALVYVSGVESGGEARPLVALAQANDAATAGVIGIATHSIENNTYGYVASFGQIRNINTSSFTAGDPIYLSATVAGEYTSTAPTSPNYVKAVGYVINSDASAGSLLIAITPDVSNPVGDAEGLTLTCRKGSPGTISAGQAVYVAGYNAGSGDVEVELADSDDASKMPAIGIARDTFTNSTNGSVVISGLIVSQDTSAYSVGDELFVDTTAGALTATRPTAASTKVQKIGIVTRSNVSNGVIEIIGAGRSNDIPNTMSDAVVRIVDNADSTKVMQFQVSGITTATTRTITMPDKDVNLATATTTNEGIVSELATDAEATALTDTSRVVTPSNLAAVFASPPELGSTAAAVGNFTRVDCDNVRVDGSTISTTNTNGNLNLVPNGTGYIKLDEIRAFTTNGNLGLRADGTGILRLLTPGGSDALVIDANGYRFSPLQPAFCAYLGTTDSNVTGDGTVFYLGDTLVGTALTERFDLTNDFTAGASGGATFTAPIGNKYNFNWVISLEGLDGSHIAALNIVTSNEIYHYGDFDSPGTGDFSMTWSTTTDMDAADIIKYGVDITGSTKVVDVYGNASIPKTVVSGFIIS